MKKAIIICFASALLLSACCIASRETRIKTATIEFYEKKEARVIGTYQEAYPIRLVPVSDDGKSTEGLSFSFAANTSTQTKDPDRESAGTFAAIAGGILNALATVAGFFL